MLNIRSLISSKIRIELLKIMALNPESSFNINELSRRTEFSIRGVDRELKNLFSGGILTRIVSGNQHRYQLDPSCPINMEIKGIIIKTVGITDLLEKVLQPVEKEIHVRALKGATAPLDHPAMLLDPSTMLVKNKE